MAGRKSKLTPELQTELTNLLQNGLTDRDACARVGIPDGTFYRWLSEGIAAQSGVKREFHEAVIRARANARAGATSALMRGMLPAKTTTNATETISETRIGKDGKPYEYHKTVSRQSVTDQPGDWRAAVEYLKRRDPEHWSDRVIVSFSPEALIAMQQLGIDHSKAVTEFEAMVIAAAARMQNDSGQ